MCSGQDKLCSRNDNEQEVRAQGKIGCAAETTMNKHGVTFSGIPGDSRVRQTQLIVVYRSQQGLDQHLGIWIHN